MTLAELQAKRHEKARDLRAILNKAETRTDKELTDDERSQFDALDKEILTLDGDIQRSQRAEQLGGEKPGEGDPAFRGNSDAEREAAARADAERAARGSELGGLNSEQRIAKTMQEFREMTYGSPVQDKADHIRAFFAYMTTRSFDNIGRDELRVLSNATMAGGGYIVPTTFERTLLLKARDFGIMRELATIISTTQGEKITQPQENAHGVASWLAVNAAYPESDESFAQITLDAYKCGTLMRVAEELLQDSAFDLEDYIARQYATRIGILENTSYVVGDGVGKPTGLVTSTPVLAGVTIPAGGFGTAVGAADPLLKLFHGVIPAYRNRGTFLMRDATMLGVRLIKDTQGNYIWRPGLEAGQGDTLFGRPVRTDPDMPAIATGVKAVVFGDISAYVIRDVQGVGIQRLNELYAANGQVGFRAYHRTEGKLINTDACIALAGA